MLEELGIDGMSSDEEVITPEGKKYFILTPQWRAPIVMPWLRVFDALYHRQRTLAVHGDQRGCMPRQRYTPHPVRVSTSRRFVPGLPINAYRVDWLERQLDVANVVHPSAEKGYTHDPYLAEYVLLHLISLTSLMYSEDCQ